MGGNAILVPPDRVPGRLLEHVGGLLRSSIPFEERRARSCSSLDPRSLDRVGDGSLERCGKRLGLGIGQEETRVGRELATRRDVGLDADATRRQGL